MGLQAARLSLAKKMTKILATITLLLVNGHANYLRHRPYYTAIFLEQLSKSIRCLIILGNHQLS